MKYLDIDKLDVDFECRKDSLFYDFDKEEVDHVYDYKYRNTLSEISFTASGSNPFRVAVRKVRKLTGGPTLVFVWPKKSSHHGRIKNCLVPVLRGLLTGLVVLNSLHLWPGEFLPNSLPLTLPPPLPPVKCNVIEPLWSDNS